MHFRASGSLGNCRGRDLELNGLVGSEIHEILDFCQKMFFECFWGSVDSRGFKEFHFLFVYERFDVDMC